MKEMPLVTVFIPVYNAEYYLKECIDSVLAQTYQKFEIVLVDDGSVDKSLEIMESYDDERIRVYQNDKNRGIPYTRNRGLKLARGKYIAFLDADDIAYPKRLELCVDFLEKHLEYRVVGGLCDYIIDGEIKKGSRQIKSFVKQDYSALFRSPLTNSSAMIDLGFIRQHHLNYDETCFVSQDYDFFVQCIQYTSIARLKDKLVCYRTGHNNITAASVKNNSEQRNAIIKQIRRKVFYNLKISIANEEYELFWNMLGEAAVITDKNQYKELTLLLEKILLQIPKESRNICREAMQRKLVMIISEMNGSKAEKIDCWKVTPKVLRKRNI